MCAFMLEGTEDVNERRQKEEQNVIMSCCIDFEPGTQRTGPMQSTEDVSGITAIPWVMRLYGDVISFVSCQCPKNKTKQSKKQNKTKETKQNNIKQNKTKQHKTKQNNIKQNKTT